MITHVRSSIYVSCELSFFFKIVIETKYLATDGVGSRCLKSWYLQAHVHLSAPVNVTWDNLDSDWNIRFWSKGLLLIYLYYFLSCGLLKQSISSECVSKKLFFFFLNHNICCGYSKEPSQWDGSFEHPKHMLKLMGKKIFTIERWKILFI